MDVSTKSVRVNKPKRFTITLPHAESYLKDGVSFNEMDKTGSLAPKLLQVDAVILDQWVTSLALF
jgi:hypothetical protein